MKFELDHRTGSMVPKKDDNIYFAKSQGGGLIVDDKKHNIKYIIERNERITKLFGSFDKDNLNLYDMRDARIISDRVIRLLGRDNKYSDYHYFLKGYHMDESFIRNYSDFVDESVWTDIHKRSNGGIKKEDGRVIGKLEDGTILIMPNDAWAEGGELIEFSGVKYYTFKESDITIAIIHNRSSYTDTYYKYDENSEEKVNMVRCFECDDSLRTDNEFGALRALMLQKEWDDDYYLETLEVNVSYKHVRLTISSGESFKIFEDRKDAINEAVEQLENFLESETVYRKETVEHYRNVLGDDFLDVDSMEDDLKESQENYYDDLDEEDAIDELLRYEIIEDNEKYFELDEDGDTDHTLPKFNYQDYGFKYVEHYINEIDDIVDEYLSTFGYDGIENYIKYDRLAEMIIETDGPESELAGYDGVEREETIDGTTYYIYRTE